MADSSGSTEVISKIQELRRQQLEDCSNATFLGWTPESKAAHQKRADIIHLLRGQLAALNGSPLKE